MFFTECESLAERHPNLAPAVEKIDAQLREMRTAEVIRVDDLASFLGLEPNQTSAVLEGLTEAGVLREEEMVECPDCGMAVLRSDYDEALEEENGYRCTSCDCPWEDGTAQAVITYRRGENWPEFPPDSVRETTAEPYVGAALAYPKEDRIFKRQGKTWLVVYDGVPKSVGDMVGMTYIRQLLQNPGQDVHAATMRSSAAGETNTPILGSAGEVLDPQALREYRDRIAEIDEELAEAEANNDLGRKESLNEERAALYAEVGRATGLHGKNREASSDREKARQAVSAAIHRALRAIKKEHEPLWQHLQNSLKIGEFLSYQPDQPTSWTT